MLVARAEGFLAGHPAPLKEAVKRLERFAEAGADCLFAPGVRRARTSPTIVKAVAPKPVNVLVGGPTGLERQPTSPSSACAASASAAALARAAWAGVMRVARQIAEEGGSTSSPTPLPAATSTGSSPRMQTRRGEL